MSADSETLKLPQRGFQHPAEARSQTAVTATCRETKTNGASTTTAGVTPCTAAQSSLTDWYTSVGVVTWSPSTSIAVTGAASVLASS